MKNAMKTVGPTARRASLDGTPLSVSLATFNFGRRGSIQEPSLAPSYQRTGGARRNSTQLCEQEHFQNPRPRRHSSARLETSAPKFLSRKSISPTYSFLTEPTKENAVLQDGKLANRVNNRDFVNARLDKEIKHAVQKNIDGDPALKAAKIEATRMKKEARAIFQGVWSELEKTHGDRVPLPRRIIWLAGAPGAGKGTNTNYITTAAGITAPTIVMSGLLDSPVCQAVKAVGGMVDDSVVLEALMREMCDPKYRDGVVVDGFPRSSIQTELVNCMRENYTTAHGSLPEYRVAVLHVPEAESVARQLARGVELKSENAERLAKGLPLLEERATDLDPSFATTRYKGFMTHYDTLMNMKDSYPMHFIDATGSRDEVKDIIMKSFSRLPPGSALEMPVNTLRQPGDNIDRASPGSWMRPKFMATRDKVARMYSSLFTLPEYDSGIGSGVYANASM